MFPKRALRAFWARAQRCQERLRQAPKRFVYPFLAAFLAQAAPLALLMTRAYEDGRLSDWRLLWDWHNSSHGLWLMQELRADQNAYIWLIVSSTALMFATGFAVGLQEDKLRLLATTDALTNLMNRRTFSARLHQELSRAQRYERDLSLLIIDLDWLKAINDGHGHAAGDRAIEGVAAALRQTLRTADLAARYAGDEFVALLPETAAGEAMGIAQRLGERVAQLALGPQGACLSVSIGVADLACAEARSAEDLFVAADEALYRAKAAGRNNVAVATAVPPSYTATQTPLPGSL